MNSKQIIVDEIERDHIVLEQCNLKIRDKIRFKCINLKVKVKVKCIKELDGVPRKLIKYSESGTAYHLECDMIPVQNSGVKFFSIQYIYSKLNRLVKWITK